MLHFLSAPLSLTSPLEEGEIGRNERQCNDDAMDDDKEGGDKDPSSETAQLKMMIIMEAYFCKQLLLFLPKGCDGFFFEILDACHLEKM